MSEPEVINPLTKSEKELWLEALRSGKYKQGQRLLKDVDSNSEFCYCCLGVLQEILDLKSTSYSYLWIRKNTSSIPQKLSLDMQKQLSSRNDGDNFVNNDYNSPFVKHDFNQIANYIEEHVEAVDD